MRRGEAASALPGGWRYSHPVGPARPRRAGDGDERGAVFGVSNAFFGVVAGCLKPLPRQGPLEGIWCPAPAEAFSPGQAELLTAVSARYPHLTDDAFLRDNLHRWLS